MSAETNKELVRHYFNAFVSEAEEIFDAIMLPSFYVRGLHQRMEEIRADERGASRFPMSALQSMR